MKMDRKINSITALVALTTIVAIALAAHLESEYIYFGNAAIAVFWLTSSIGTIAAIVTGVKAIDLLAERFRIVS